MLLRSMALGRRLPGGGLDYLAGSASMHRGDRSGRRCEGGGDRVTEPSPSMPSETAAAAAPLRAPRVLISYVHDSDAHQEQVRDLLDLLQSAGVDVTVDQVVAEPRQDWVLWTKERMAAADYVLVIASPGYKRFLEDDRDEGRGSRDEVLLIREVILRDRSERRRILPVLLPGGKWDDVPTILEPYSGPVYRVSAFTAAGAESLLQVLHHTDSPAALDLSPAALSVLRACVAEAGDAPVTFDHVLLAALRRPSTGRDDVAAGVVAGLAKIQGREPDDFVKSLAAELRLHEYRESSMGIQALAANPGVGEVVRAAQELLNRLGLVGSIHLRHLLGAVVATGPQPPVMAALGVTDDALRELLVAVIEERLPDEANRAWRSALIPAGTLPARRQILTGGHTADLVDPEQGISLDRDYLDVGTYVQMLARVIASDETPLPLSVGLFGEWGSGKSYFMGLLREQVSQLSTGRGSRSTPARANTRSISRHRPDRVQRLELRRQQPVGQPGRRDLPRARGHVVHRRGGRAQRKELRDELDHNLTRAQELQTANKKAVAESTRLRAEAEAAAAEQRPPLTGLLASAATVALDDGKALDDVWKQLGVQEEAERGRFARRPNCAAVRPRWTPPAGPSWLARRRPGRPERRCSSCWCSSWCGRGSFRPSPGDGQPGRRSGGVRGDRDGVAAGRAPGCGPRPGRPRIATSETEQERRRILQAALDTSARPSPTSQVMLAQLDEVLTRAGEIERELVDCHPANGSYASSPSAVQPDYRREAGPDLDDPARLPDLVALMKEWTEERQADGDQSRPGRRPDRTLHRRPRPLLPTPVVECYRPYTCTACVRLVRRGSRRRPAVAAALATGPVPLNSRHEREEQDPMALHAPRLPREDLQHPVRSSRH